MNRRSPIALLALAAATLAGGCTTLSDSNDAARVDDATYTRDELVTELEELGASPEQLVQADLVRAQVSAWVAEQVTAAQDPSLLSEAYAEGLAASGSICVELIALASRADAEVAVVALDDGTPFSEVFTASNSDPSLDATAGRVGCLALAELDIDGGNPLVDSIVDMNAANPHAIALLPGETAETDLYVVSRFIPFDELGPDETPTVTSAQLSADDLGLDIFIDPHIGTYDNATGAVIPLG